VNSNSSKKRVTNPWIILTLAVLVIALGGTAYYYLTAHTSTEEKTVETSTIGTGDIILSATGPGTLVPKEEVSFGFKNSGTVNEVLVKLGDQVTAGQVLARQENSILKLKYQQAAGNLAALSTPAEIASAEQAVKDAEQSFATARNDLQYLIGPDMLIAEEKVASAQQDLQTAKAALEQDASDANKQKVSEAEASLKKAQDNLSYAYYNFSSTYTRETFTYPIRNDKGVTIRRDLIAPTDADLLAARAAYELAAANVADARNYLDVLHGVKEINAVPASSVTTITEAKAAFDTAKANLDATELVAPISGTITSIDLTAGDEAGTSAAITISDLTQPYLIDASLDETDWDKAKVGFTASVTFDLLPNNTYSGKIVQVYPKLDDSSGTNMVHILLQLDESVKKDLPLGSTASVDVTGGEALGAVLVPTSALKEVQSGKYVVYMIKNGTPVQQEVEIGLQDILNAEVKSGLQKGDVVLTDATAVNQ
jgi:multidrug efflux pump subunit AcrA (membrane-fusion protein)